MKKHYIRVILFLIMIQPFATGVINAEEKILSSRIASVKLYQNQAEIVRKVTLTLKKGSNTIVLGGLPKLLHDWSAKGRLPKNFKGKILSLEVEQKALVKKRQKNILKIEQKLEQLREKDQVLVDKLKNIRSQEKFLNSILEFTNQTVSKELATRIPQVKVWDNTLNYVNKKKSVLSRKKRKVEKARENIGKEIQKWEFELSQIAGYNYFRNYQVLNKVVLANRAAMNVQQFANINEQYGQRDTLLKKPTDKVDIEKRLIVNVYSARTGPVEFNFSYLIPGTYWKMLYDIRASNENKDIDMVIYANVYQKTGEDWKNVSLALSTGSPVNAIRAPVVNPWFLDLYSKAKPSGYGGGYYKSRKKSKGARAYPSIKREVAEEKAVLPQTTISDKGPYIDISLPLKQSILSTNKYQKKYIKNYKLSGMNNVFYYYELTPANVRNSFLKVKTKNTTKLPWLTGNAQIFLENEFMGKVKIPYTPPGKKEDFVLGLETRITAKKELVKKFEDTSGVFGGNRRISYKYKIVVENELPGKAEVMIIDAIPVSRNDKIKVEIKNLSRAFHKDPEFEKTTKYSRGIRKWKLSLSSHEKKEITYEVIIAFDKDINIRGLR
ncbi:MAG: DUF4139 domain-containing protein [bacterium]|nr:DUF4139 domain-containing protein [bacterium]